MADNEHNKTEAEQRRDSRRRRKTIVKWVKRGMWGLAGVVLLFLTVRAFMPKPVPVDAAAASRGTLTVTIDEDGKTRIKDRYILIAPLTGNMMRLQLDPGDQVKAQSAVVHILPTTPTLLDARTRKEAEARLAAAIAAERQSRAQIAAARAAYDQAKAELKRNEPLAKRGAVPEAELERSQFLVRSRREEVRSARFSAKVAAEQVASARAALGFLTGKPGKGGKDEPHLIINAPTGGRVLRVFRRDAGVVAAGTNIVELGDPAFTEVVADVLTRDGVKIKPGARVTIHRWGGGKKLSGHVHRVEPAAFERISALGVEEQRVNVIIHIDDKRERWAALGDGYRVEVSIVVWQGKDVLSVPANAVFRHKQGWAVFAIKGGKAVLTPIEVGQRNPRKVQVLGGLSAGVEVVLHPSDRISDGVKVTKRPAE